MSVDIDCVIFDLDGTLLCTETLVIDVARKVLEKFGKELTNEVIEVSLGKRPLDAWASVIDVLEMENVTAQELFDASEPELTARWHEAEYLPGAERLVTHLKENNHRIALATSTSRRVLERKLKNKPLLQSCFDTVVCGDDPDLERGKPAPDSFLKVSKELGISPDKCLVIEDAPSGFEAARAAGMHVVYIPSLRTDNTSSGIDSQGITTTVLSSLLEFNPTCYNLTPFSDHIGECIPLDTVWRIQATVVVGFGRGAAKLGIPTANLDAFSVSRILSASVTGIYFGWSTVADSTTVYPMCCSIGYNPVFNNTDKTCEAWILHDFGPGASFVGETIRLIICGYIRPESGDFDSLDALIKRIHQDAAVATVALKHPRLEAFKDDPFFKL
jgi:HAD superfamily hydrolase (TIGR01509 family)